jgi:hypothetical protein
VTATCDWLRDPRVSWAWGAAFLVVALGRLAVPHPAGSWLAALGFALAGGLCIGNVLRCGRAHCAITGPLYLLAAALFASHAASGVVIVAASIGGTLLAYIPEWLGLRYLRRGPRVELVYAEACPNAPEARANLARAFAATRLTPAWTEWEVSSPASPARVRTFGSPTVLVDGRDVAGAEPMDASGCRVYGVGGRTRGAPPPELIARALAGALGHRSPALLAAVPAAVIVLVPTLTCPACWPAYAAMLSALGLGFVPTTPYLLPLTIVLLVIALAGLALRAPGRLPLLLGLVATPIVLLGKFVFASSPATYAGAGLLVAASLSALRRERTATCSACGAPDASVERR